MPPVKQPERPTIQKSTEQRDVEKLAEVLWKHGDPTTEHCRREIIKAGIRMDEVTPAMLHRAEELNQERLREGFRNTNANPNHRVKVVVAGDNEFDPSLNPSHPIRGAAKIKQEHQAQQPSSTSSTRKGIRARNFLFGYPATAVFRTMGKIGLSLEEATKVVDHFKVNTTKACLYTFLRAGAKGERGDPAPLTATEKKEVVRIAKET